MKEARIHKTDLSDQKMEEVSKQHGMMTGLIEEPDHIPQNARKHSVTNWQCTFCSVRFFFRAEAICSSCGNCQSCGLYNENRQVSSCLCGNELPADAPEVIVRRVRVVNNLTERGGRGRV